MADVNASSRWKNHKVNYFSFFTYSLLTTFSLGPDEARSNLSKACLNKISPVTVKTHLFHIQAGWETYTYIFDDPVLDCAVICVGDILFQYSKKEGIYTGVQYNPKGNLFLVTSILTKSQKCCTTYFYWIQKVHSQLHWKSHFLHKNQYVVTTFKS